MKRKWIALVSALVLCLGLVPGALAAERGTVTYTEVIAPQYEDAHSFAEDLAAVKKDGKWGYIDTAGQVVVPFQYDLAYNFNEGLAVVGTVLATEEGVDWKWDEETGELYEVPATWYTVEHGFIDKTGAYTPFMNEDLFGGQEDPDTFPLQEDMTDLEFEGGDKIFHNGYIWLCAEDGITTPYVLFNTAGKVVKGEATGDVLCTAAPMPVNEGLATIGSLLDGDLAFADVKTGETVIDSKDIPGVTADEYVDFGVFNQGLAPAYILTRDKDAMVTKWKDVKMGFLDRQGNWVIQPTLGDGYYMRGVGSTQRIFGETGLGMVKGANGKFGAIDKQGNTVIPFQYDELWSDCEGRAAFCQDGKYGYLDAAGGDHSVVIPAQFEAASGFNNGLAAVYDGEKAYLIDWDGNPVPGTQDLDPDAYFKEYENGNKETHDPEEYLTICRDGKYGFGHIEYLPELPQESEMDAWAYEEVTAAIEAELVPASMQNLYSTNITRGEFCALAVQAIEAVTGQDIADVVKARTDKELSAFQREYPFLDASGEDVIACYALGILQGRGDGVADPYASITRQEAAAYLARTATVMGMDVSAGDALSFADAGSVGQWFTQAVAFVCESGVMNGTGDNQFSPLGSYTREQSYTTFYRLYNAAK